MGMHRKNKGHEGDRGRKEFAGWFWPSVARRRMRNWMRKVSRGVALMKRKAKKGYIKRHGFLAQGFQLASSRRIADGCKIRKLRTGNKRGMDGTMRS